MSGGSTFISDGVEFEISYFGDLGTNSFTGGNDVAIRVVPEPSSSLLALGAAGLILAGRRRRATRLA